jgi:hypothetical protein
MSDYELIKYIEKIKNNEYKFDDEGLKNISDSEMRDFSCLCSGGKYIKSKNDIIPLYSQGNFCGGDFLGFGIDAGIRGFIPSELRPELCITDLAEEYYKDYMTEKENENKLSYLDNRGGTYIGGDAEDNKIVNKTTNKSWNWCINNKLCIGSLILNAYFIIHLLLSL